MLNIESVKLYTGQMPCDLEFSYGSRRSLSYTIVEIRAGKWSGVGEGLGRRLEDYAELGRTLLGRDAFLLDQLIPRIETTLERPVFVPVPREAYSMALHDLVCKAMGVPLYVLMGGLRRSRVPVMACLFPKSPAHAEETARKFAGMGCTALKVKNFGKPELDCELIRAVRRAFPNGWLQSDPNCGYKSFEAAADVLPKMAAAGLTAVEDPGECSLADYKRLMDVSPRPRIILDGPSRGDAAIGEVARLRPADVVNLHPNMQGTFSDIRDRAAAVRLAGMGIEIGGTGYTGVGAWAHLHVAAVYGEGFPYGELGGCVDHGMPACTALEPIPISKGFAAVPDKPGHGGELNMEFLSANAQRTEIA